MSTLSLSNKMGYAVTSNWGKYMKLLLQLAFLQFLGMVLVYTVSQAAPSKLVAHMLSSETVINAESQFPKNVSVSLQKIEEVAVYRCMNCYDFKLTYAGINIESGKKIKFSKLVSVRGGQDEHLNVTLIKP